ncbi:Protocadherin Beta-12 [Manis pentadactyla]|nr:Protocadherin Beta-12 [Manis pentadactyla]
MKDHFEMTCIHTQPVSPGRRSGQAEGRLSGGPVAVTAPRLAHREYRTCSHLSKHLLAKLPGPDGLAQASTVGEETLPLASRGPGSQERHSLLPGLPVVSLPPPNVSMGHMFAVELKNRTEKI